MSKLILPKETQEWLDTQAVTGYPHKNIYTCDTCHKEVVTIDIDKGVTPFMIACRATPNCKGFMQSHFYNCPAFRIAQFEFYRPDTLKGFGKETKEHIMKGGLLLRPINGTSDIPHDA